MPFNSIIIVVYFRFQFVVVSSNETDELILKNSGFNKFSIESRKFMISPA